MDKKTFDEKFEIDRSAKGIRATEKPAAEPVRVVLTADGEQYDPAREYYFADRLTHSVQSSKYLKRLTPFHIGDMNRKHTAIDQLRADRIDAIEDLEKIIVKEIDALRDKIRELEADKPPAKRTTKFLLMAKG